MLTLHEADEVAVPQLLHDFDLAQQLEVGEPEALATELCLVDDPAGRMCRRSIDTPEIALPTHDPPLT